MVTQQLTANGKARLAGIAFGAIGALFVASGIALFTSHLSVAGYGIWVFVWGLAFLLGAVSRFAEARA